MIVIIVSKSLDLYFLQTLVKISIGQELFTSNKSNYKTINGFKSFFLGKEG